MSSTIFNPLGCPVRSLHQRLATWNSVMASSESERRSTARAPPSRRHHSPSFTLSRPMLPSSLQLRSAAAPAAKHREAVNAQTGNQDGP